MGREVWAEVVRFGDCRPLLHSGAGLLASAVIGPLRSSRSLRWSESESEADAVQGLSLDATDRARPPAAASTDDVEDEPDPRL